MTHDLFIGVTTWNSELFLDQCLEAIQETTRHVKTRIAIVDNLSTDRTQEIAKARGVDVHVEHCSQAIALNRLLDASSAPYTLLMHSDVILLPDWFDTCTQRLSGDCALVSPEDIGCGPLTRPYGAGMPESCFIYYDTAKARQMRRIFWRRRRGLPWPVRMLDLEGYHVTHDLPETLRKNGFTWKPMRPHASPQHDGAPYAPPFTPEYWSEELGTLRYAMGNFYSLDGVISHYHNWFDRVPKNVPLDSTETTVGQGQGLPLAFLSLGTQRFLDDLAAGELRMPSPDEPERIPAVTPRNKPDLQRPYTAMATPSYAPSATCPTY